MTASMVSSVFENIGCCGVGTTTDGIDSASTEEDEVETAAVHLEADPSLDRPYPNHYHQPVPPSHVNLQVAC